MSKWGENKQTIRSVLAISRGKAKTGTNEEKHVKACFYIAQYAVRPVHFQHKLDFSRKHSSHTAIRREDYALTFAT